MGGFDDHVAIMGDWVPPSPSPRGFFSSVLGDEISSRSISENPFENKNGVLFPGPEERIMSGRSDEKDGAQDCVADDQLTKSNLFSEQKMNSRGGGLLERMAARAGFNAPRLNTESIRPADLSLNPDVRSPYLTIPPGLSPTSLLESPVFLSNSLAQPSPTTGKFAFPPSGNGRNSTLATEATDKSRDNFFEDINTSSFAFKPVAESSPSLFLGTTNQVILLSLCVTHTTPHYPHAHNISHCCEICQKNQLSGTRCKRIEVLSIFCSFKYYLRLCMQMASTFPQTNFPGIEVSVQPKNSLQSRYVEPAKLQSQNGTTLNRQDSYRMCSEKEAAVGGASAENSPPFDELQDEEAHERGGGDTVVGGAPSEDGYNWRKYGQKQVKGSEYPRSYYKCTHPNCPVKKKVERSHEGHITEIIYKGAHSHPKPPLNRRSTIGSSNPLTDMQLDIGDQTGAQIGADGEPVWSTVQKGVPDWRHDNLEVTSLASVGAEYCNAPNSMQGQNGTHVETGDAVDVSSTFSNEEDEDDRGTHGSISLGCDGEGDESESKRRLLFIFVICLNDFHDVMLDNQQNICQYCFLLQEN
ncbi:hypothetical protein ACSBR2_028542 [Camellia fascicularis]